MSGASVEPSNLARHGIAFHPFSPPPFQESTVRRVRSLPRLWWGGATRGGGGGGGRGTNGGWFSAPASFHRLVSQARARQIRLAAPRASRRAAFLKEHGPCPVRLGGVVCPGPVVWASRGPHFVSSRASSSPTRLCELLRLHPCGLPVFCASSPRLTLDSALQPPFFQGGAFRAVCGAGRHQHVRTYSLAHPGTCPAGRTCTWAECV